jgi:hypothetical protein
MDCKLLWALTVLAVTGCGKTPDDGSSGSNESAAATATTNPNGGTESVTPGTTPAAPSSHSGGPATWSNLPAGAAWTNATLAAVSANLSNLEAAKDKETYCPGYASASLAARKTCWVRLVSAVVQYESAFDPMNKYKESDGHYSVGLMQLSTGECSNAETLGLLQDPVKNLQCGTAKMAALIARDGYITTPDNVHGAAAYWSTLRRPYTSGNLHLGKALEVQKITKQFLSVEKVEMREEMLASDP